MQTGPKQIIALNNSKFSDFNMHLDCANRVVDAEPLDQSARRAQLPIDSDGTVRGNLQYPGQVNNDGQGNQQCWVDFVVAFDGRANCDDRGGHSLSLNTMVNFMKARRSTMTQARARAVDRAVIRHQPVARIGILR